LKDINFENFWENIKIVYCNILIKQITKTDNSNILLIITLISVIFECYIIHQRDDIVSALVGFAYFRCHVKEKKHILKSF